MGMLRSLYRFLHPKVQTLFLEYRVRFVPRYGHGKPAHPELLAAVEKGRADYRGFIEEILSYKENLQAIRPSGSGTSSTEPVWNNEFLPGLDIAGLYAMIAKHKPKKYVEIGSGNSTKVAFKAKKEQHPEMEIVSIDPYPRVEIDGLSDRVLRQPFEECSLDLVNELAHGDILFIDNSHRILPNSDSLVVFMEILPRLKKGVIVHFHDIYIPYDYPQFMCDRFYSEQYGLALFVLLDPVKYRTLFPCYFVSEDAELSAHLAPLWAHPNLAGVERHGGSYWLQIEA